MSESSAVDELFDAVPATGRRERTRTRRRLPSVRLLITLIVVLPIAVVSIALISIATLMSQSIAQQLGDKIVTTATDRAISDVRNYLDSAMRISDLYTLRIVNGTLPLNDFSQWEQSLFQDLATNPDVSSICFTTPNGDCTWLLRAHNRLELGTVNGNDRDHAVEYAARPDGTVDRTKPLRVYRYDAPERPWYKIAMSASEPTWTPIYFWFGETGPASTTGTGYTRQVRNDKGELLGVLIIDVTLGALSEHLVRQHVGNPEWTFLIDDGGKMVAASDGAVNSDQGERLTAAQSNSRIARAIAPLVAEDIMGQELATDVSVHRVKIDGEPALARVTEIRPYKGIHWHVATVLPEASFMSDVASLRRRAVLLAVGTIIASLAIGLTLSRRLSGPLVQLAHHVARVGGGDFDSRLNLGHAAELRRLSDEVNRMAGGLKHRMKLQHSLAIATQVQQSLLPKTQPAPKGLEIAACNRYCDSTGGDYFDFIEMNHMGKPQTLIAVGDVTGHGIGAALLMATARGAVRASVPNACSLSQVMAETNRVLAGHTNSGMFMTMALVLVDPETQLVHWSSAGHDPTIVYHPENDSFSELGFGDVPLGIEPDVCYRDHMAPTATPGTIYCIGTDGIWEARNANREMFGKQRLRELIRKHHRSAEELAEAIKFAMWNWVGSAPLQDDVTFVVIRVRE